MARSRTSDNQTAKRMKKRKVYWTPQETLAVHAFVESHPYWPTARAVMKAQELLLPTDRHVVRTTIYNSLSTGSYHRKVDQAKANCIALPPPVKPQIELLCDEPEEDPPIKLDEASISAVAEKVAAIVLPSLVDAMRDLVISQRISKMVPTDEDIRTILQNEPARVKRISARRRIDILGLLPSQAEVVKTYLGPRDDLKLRFILSEHASKVDRYAPDVIVCTGFISHSHQDQVRASGSRVHYANGAAASVTNALSKIL